MTIIMHGWVWWTWWCAPPLIHVTGKVSSRVLLAAQRGRLHRYPLRAFHRYKDMRLTKIFPTAQPLPDRGWWLLCPGGGNLGTGRWSDMQDVPARHRQCRAWRWQPASTTSGTSILTIQSIRSQVRIRLILCSQSWTESAMTRNSIIYLTIRVATTSLRSWATKRWLLPPSDTGTPGT